MKSNVVVLLLLILGTSTGGFAVPLIFNVSGTITSVGGGTVFHAGDSFGGMFTVDNLLSAFDGEGIRFQQATPWATEIGAYSLGTNYTQVTFFSATQQLVLYGRLADNSLGEEVSITWTFPPGTLQAGNFTLPDFGLGTGQFAWQSPIGSGPSGIAGWVYGDVTVTPVPLAAPNSLLLAGTGLGLWAVVQGLTWARYRKRARNRARNRG